MRGPLALTSGFVLGVMLCLSIFNTDTRRTYQSVQTAQWPLHVRGLGLVQGRNPYEDYIRKLNSKSDILIKFFRYPCVPTQRWPVTDRYTCNCRYHRYWL